MAPVECSSRFGFRPTPKRSFSRFAMRASSAFSKTTARSPLGRRCRRRSCAFRSLSRTSREPARLASELARAGEEVFVIHHRDGWIRFHHERLLASRFSHPPRSRPALAAVKFVLSVIHCTRGVLRTPTAVGWGLQEVGRDPNREGPSRLSRGK